MKTNTHLRISKNSNDFTPKAKRSKILSLSLTLALCFCSTLVAGEAETKSSAAELKAAHEHIIKNGIEESQAKIHLDTLVNRFGPRLTGSNALMDSCNWAVSQFESFGLENVHLEEAGEFPIGFNRGPWWGWIHSPEKKSLAFTTNSWTAGTQGRVRAKAVIAAASMEEIEKQEDELRGNYVLLPTPSRMSRAHMTFIRELRKKLNEFKVAGVITGTRGQLLVTSGSSPKSWDELPTVPQIRMGRDEFKKLYDQVLSGDSVELEFDIRNFFKQGPVKYFNVIADISGTTYPDEIVIVGGHIDSWDGATGTLDNGTGVATTLEAARLLMESGVRPKRTIRFMLWSGEEQGLLGSRAYIKKHEDLLPKISAVLVHDGGTNFVSGIAATAAMQADLEQVFAPIQNLSPDRPFKVRPVNGLPVGIGSDHDSFLRRDVPGFFWDQSGKSDYKYSHHTQHDYFNQAIDEYQRHSSVVIAIGALGIANLDHMISREGLKAPAPRRMGVFLDELTTSRVLNNSVAEKAGLKAGDVFVSVDGKTVKDRRELVQAIRSKGFKKKVKIKRANAEMEIVMEWPKPKAKAKAKAKPKAKPSKKKLEKL